MILTPEGQRFLAYTDRLLALANEARQAMRQKSPSGRLSIGTMESAAATRLPQPLSRFHARWPEVELEVQTGTTRMLVEGVLGHQLDCALVAHPSPGSPSSLDMGELGAGLDGQFLFFEQLVLVLPVGHRKVRRPEEVSVPCLATFSRGCTYRQCALDWLSAHRPAGDQPRIIERSSYSAMLASVTAGSAAAVLP